MLGERKETEESGPAKRKVRRANVLDDAEDR